MSFVWSRALLCSSSSISDFVSMSTVGAICRTSPSPSHCPPEWTQCGAFVGVSASGYFWRSVSMFWWLALQAFWWHHSKFHMLASAWSPVHRLHFYGEHFARFHCASDEKPRDEQCQDVPPLVHPKLLAGNSLLSLPRPSFTRSTLLHVFLLETCSWPSTRQHRV